MRSPRISRQLASLAVAIAAVTATQTASASPPTDLAPLGPLHPSCTASAPDTSGAHICWAAPIHLPVGGWQASTGEWIILRLGNAIDVDPSNPGAAKSLCDQLQASIVATIVLDGEPLQVDTIPCELRLSGDPTQPDVYFVDWRALSHPLTSGVHTFSESWYSTTTGVTSTFGPATLTIMPQG